MEFFKKKRKRKQVSTKELEKQLKLLEEKLGTVTEELASFKEAMKKAVTKVGIIRYNPFKDIGGNQSFSVALLDANDSGVVVTSHYGRDVNRIYAKPIHKGKPEYSLSQEEEQAVEKALKG